MKPNKLDDRIVTINIGPGARFAVRGYTLVLLMQQAYGVMGWNVTGGPAWIRSDRWDIAAKAPVSGNLTEAQLRPMLQALLADRFHLKVHEGSKEMPGYALVVAKGGLKARLASRDEPHSDTFRMGGTGLSVQGISMPDFARFVAGKLGWIAVDQTGLQGLYDLKAEWTVGPDQPGVDPRDALREAALDAIEHQLGLKLVPRKITVRMLFIDNVEKPSEN